MLDSFGWTVIGALAGIAAALIAALSWGYQIRRDRAVEVPRFAATMQRRGDVGQWWWNARVRVTRYPLKPLWSITDVSVSKREPWRFTLVPDDHSAPTADALLTDKRDLRRVLSETANSPSIGPSLFFTRIRGRGAGRCTLRLHLERETGERRNVRLRLIFSE